MMKVSWMVAVTASAVTLGLAAPVRALDKCTARVRLTDGTILVGAKSVSGTLLWGNSAGTETNAFGNAATCVTGSPLVAKNCTLGTGPVAITPPSLCTLYLKDGSGMCSAFIKKCTPGRRPLVELPSRFVDNGDGTVTDTQTGLMWEKKTGTVGGSGDFNNPENVNNYYTWTASGTAADGAAFTDFLPRVNGALCSMESCPALGGHSDWRLPTSAELQTIIELSASGCGSGSPCINTVFGPTQAFVYWSSSTVADGPTVAWQVEFFGGDMVWDGKFDGWSVRAVRSGF